MSSIALAAWSDGQWIDLPLPSRNPSLDGYDMNKMRTFFVILPSGRTWNSAGATAMEQEYTSCTMWNSGSEKVSAIYWEKGCYPRSVLPRPRFWMSLKSRSCTALICRRKWTSFPPRVPCICHLLAFFWQSTDADWLLSAPGWLP